MRASAEVALPESFRPVAAGASVESNHDLPSRMLRRQPAYARPAVLALHPVTCALASVQPLFDIFLATMQGASYNASTPLYVASGLLTYLSQDGENFRSASDCCCSQPGALLLCHNFLR